MIKGLRGIGTVFILMAVVFAASIVFTFLAGQKVLEIYREAVAHRAIIAETEDLLATVTDAETGNAAKPASTAPSPSPSISTSSKQKSGN